MGDNGASSSGQGIFLRETTGLVREMKWHDALFINLLNMSVGVGVAYVIFLGPGIFPGANVTLGLVLCAIGCFFGMYCFSALTAAMPRSGGDYVFVSRVLHPSIGFGSSWMWVFWNVVWCAILGTWVVTWGLRDLFGMLGVVNNDPNLLDWADRLSQPDHPITFTLTAMVVILSGVMLALGTKLYLRVQAVCAIIGLIMLVVVAAIFLTTSNQEFSSTWDQYATGQGAADYSETVADAAYDSPWYNYSDWQLTLAILPIGLWSLAYPYFTSFVGGELKTPRRTALIGNMGALVIGAAFIIGLWSIITNTLGDTFIQGTYAQFYEYGSTSYGMPSVWFDFHAGIASKSSAAVYIIGIGMVAWLLMYPALACIGQTRAALAWSMDRIVPSWFGKVSERWNSPLNAIVFFTTINMIYLAFYARFSDYQGGFTAVLGQALATFTLVGFAAILLPYRKKTRKIYESSGMNHKIFGVPLITISGIIWVAFLSVSIWYFMIDPNLGATDYWSPVTRYFSLYLTVAIFFAGFALYWVSRWYRKKHGVNIDLAFEQLPPE
ncbi:MAG: APC family permease [Candidatus Thermoplasmatota archaeon]|nr:APC family permease [Candidatus Thermoplasmatota archaeon]